MPKRGKKEADVITRFDERGVHVFKGRGQHVESFRDLRSAFQAGKPVPAEAAAEAAAGSGASSSAAGGAAVEKVVAEDDPVAEGKEQAQARTPSANRKRPHAETALDFLSPCIESRRALLGALCFSQAGRDEAEELLAAMSAIMSAELVEGNEKHDWPEIIRLHYSAAELIVSPPERSSDGRGHTADAAEPGRQPLAGESAQSSAFDGSSWHSAGLAAGPASDARAEAGEQCENRKPRQGVDDQMCIHIHLYIYSRCILYLVSPAPLAAVSPSDKAAEKPKTKSSSTFADIEMQGLLF